MGLRSRLTLALGVSILLIFANTIDGTFLWDDQQFVLENQNLRSWQQLPELFTQNIVGGAGIVSNLYRPIQSFTHFLDLQIWGGKAWGHRLTNVLLIALAAMLLFQVLLSMSKDNSARVQWLAAGITWLYFVHPLQSQAVGYISGRGDNLVMIFLFSTILLYRRHRFLALLTCVLGILSKENGLLIPAFVLMYDYFFSAEKKISRLACFSHLVFWASAFGYLALRMTVLNFQNFTNFYGSSNAFVENFSYRLFTYFSVFAKGLSLWVWPFEIHHERSWRVYISLAEVLPLAGLGLLVLCAVLTVLCWKKRPLISLGLLWLVGSTVPVSNLLVVINALIYDHWFILPGLGLHLCLFGLIAQKSSWAWGRNLKILGGAALTVFSLIMIGLTLRQNNFWRNPPNLFEHILQHEPTSVKIMNNLAMHYETVGRPEEARNLYLKAISTEDIYAQTHHNLGVLYLRESKYSLAASEFEKAIKMDPKLFQSWTSLGILALRHGEPAQAAHYFESSIKIHPSALAFQGLVQCYEVMKMKEKAADVQQEAKKHGF